MRKRNFWSWKRKKQSLRRLRGEGRGTIILVGRKANRMAGIMIMSRRAMILGNAVTMKILKIAMTMIIDERKGGGDGTTVETHPGVGGEGIGVVNVIGVEEIDRLIHAGVATRLEAVVANEDEEDRKLLSSRHRSWEAHPCDTERSLNLSPFACIMLGWTL
mmetsp:Transcript_3212/g.4363  ORF Transcript_3212/g.4363 Transcript_3212/m.4363 type:complete len:161 (+) Transcript_3212:347-829(+)